ncbi:MAG: hypothetical protein U0M06_11405 [Clostridia bacterium]|nr:hypothetical protein [Clostridia bacterium]
MAENKLCSSSRDLVCIEANRVLDSCRDRDCFEEVGVYLTDFGQEIIEHTGNVRVKCANIAWTSITVDPVQFNRGFYSVNVRFFVNLRFEACVGGRSQEFDGVTALDKRVILFGGECGVSTYHSGTCTDSCDPTPATLDSALPTATVDVASPVLLDAKVVEEKDCSCCLCCCCAEEIPEYAYRNIGAPIRSSRGNRVLLVSLGVFSVVRLTRPAQYLINATEYSVPDKECSCGEEKSPCCLFRSMDFPTDEFCGSGYSSQRSGRGDKGCGCKGDTSY